MMTKFVFATILSFSVFFFVAEAKAATIVVSQEGVAPLYVNFYDSDVEASDGVGVEPFHDYEYRWDFGDPGSGVWGTDGKSKNTAKGAVAAHVYEDPGTYTITLEVYNGSVIDTDTVEIVVTDPDQVYASTLTTCVNTSSDSDFSSCPSEANQVQTDDITSITSYADAGERMLFKRGSSWSVPTRPDWPDNAGPVSFGAYGECVGEDSYGICSNAPEFVAPNDFFHMEYKQNYRIYDLRIVGAMGGGAMDMQRALFYQLDMEDAPGTSIGWSHWNDSSPIPIDQIAIVSCRILDSSSHAVYAGGERLAIMGNHFDDSGESHLVRVWQAYRSVIQHNIHSHTNMDNSNGRLALKLHSPGYRPAGSWGAEARELCPITQAGGCLENSTQYTVVSDNLYGGSAYTVTIGAQDTVTEVEMSDIIFERNRIIPSFDPGNAGTYLGLLIGADYTSVRNNIFDMSDSQNSVNAMQTEDGAGENKTGVKVYNNTIYRSDSSNDWNKILVVTSKFENTESRNNLVYQPNTVGPVVMVEDGGIGTIESNNLRITTDPFMDSANASVLDRDFSIMVSATEVIDQGYSVPVYEDYLGEERSGAYEIGAHNYDSGAPVVVIRADVNQDSSVNSSDALLVLRRALNRSMSGTSWQSSATTGDVNCDGSVTTVDALLLLREHLGLDNSGNGWCGG